MTDPMRGEKPRQGHLESLLTPRTAVSGLGLVGVAAGLWLVAGVPGVVATVAVAVVLYTLSGVYAFGAGQFVLVATVPTRITPELVLVELGLALVLVGEVVVSRGLVRVVLVGIALALVAVGVGTSAGGGERDVAFLAGVGFVLVAGALWLFARSVEAGSTTGAQARPTTDASDSHGDGSGW